MVKKKKEKISNSYWNGLALVVVGFIFIFSAVGAIIGIPLVAVGAVMMGRAEIQHKKKNKKK